MKIKTSSVGMNLVEWRWKSGMSRVMCLTSSQFLFEKAAFQAKSISLGEGEKLNVIPFKQEMRELEADNFADTWS